MEPFPFPSNLYYSHLFFLFNFLFFFCSYTLNMVLLHRVCMLIFIYWPKQLTWNFQNAVIYKYTSVSAVQDPQKLVPHQLVRFMWEILIQIVIPLKLAKLPLYFLRYTETCFFFVFVFIKEL